MRHPFTSTTLLIAGGLLAWLAEFVFVYGFAAVACARGFADVSLLGLPIVPVLTIVTSLVTAAITVMLVRRGRRLQSELGADDHSRFIGFVIVASGGIALIALVLLVLPAIVVSACSRM